MDLQKIYYCLTSSSGVAFFAQHKLKNKFFINLHIISDALREMSDMMVHNNIYLTKT